MGQTYFRPSDNYFSFDDALSSIGGMTDFVVPGASQNISNWWNKAEEAPVFSTKPLRKGAEFLFNSIVPQGPEDEIFNFVNPTAGAALNIPRKALKQLGEESLDTIGDYFEFQPFAEKLKDVLAKYPRELLGYAGGEGKIGSPNKIQDVKDTFTQIGPATRAYYQPMFSDVEHRTEFSDYMKSLDPESFLTPSGASGYLRGTRIKPAFGFKEDDLWVLDNLKDVVKHEMRHMGQDVAPGGITPAYSKHQRYGSPGRNLPYEMSPQEILVRAHKSIDPSMGSIRPSQRIQKAMEKFGTEDILFGRGRTPIPQEYKDFFLETVLPMLYGKR